MPHTRLPIFTARSQTGSLHQQELASGALRKAEKQMYQNPNQESPEPGLPWQPVAGSQPKPSLSGWGPGRTRLGCPDGETSYPGWGALLYTGWGKVWRVLCLSPSSCLQQLHGDHSFPKDHPSWAPAAAWASPEPRLGVGRRTVSDCLDLPSCPCGEEPARQAYTSGAAS